MKLAMASNAIEVSAQDENTVQQDVFEPSEPLNAQILPYTFAKRHGVLIGQIDDQEVNVLHQGLPAPIVLAEVSRITRRKISLSQISDEQFSALLAQTYEQGSDQAAGLGLVDLAQHNLLKLI